MTKPDINVTPLIDVLLVLLIIFMVVAPSKPTDFKTKIPQEPKDIATQSANNNTLVVTISAESKLSLNRETNLGTIAEPDKLIERMRRVFEERTINRSYDAALALRSDLPESEKILKTVFIKAPRGTAYGSVVKVIDAVKISGA